MKIPTHTTQNEPEDYTPFSMVFGSTWKAYNAGELNSEKLLLMNILYRRVNPYNGIGQISYTEICVLLKRKPTGLNVNGINKLMMDLRDEHQLIWFPEHKGRRVFPYVIADFKLALKPNETDQKWVDVKPYFQTSTQSNSRGNESASPRLLPESLPRRTPPEQRFERSNGGSFISASDIFERGLRRPPQTNTESET